MADQKAKTDEASRVAHNAKQARRRAQELHDRADAFLADPALSDETRANTQTARNLAAIAALGFASGYDFDAANSLSIAERSLGNASRQKASDDERKRRLAAQRGGSASKKKNGIAEVMSLLISENPDRSWGQAWLRIPESRNPLPVYSGGREFLVYREGDAIVQVNDRDGSSEISKATAKRYFYDARRKFRTN